MTAKRPKSLKWSGDVYPDGRPARYLDFVPARDLDEAETDALTQDQLKAVRDSGLYREVAQPEPKKKSSKKAKATETAQDEPGTDTTGDEPITAAEPVTESEE